MSERLSEEDTLRAVIFRMAEDLTRIKAVCTQEHPPKMGNSTRDWPAGTQTRHSDGTWCVLLNDGDYAILAARLADQAARLAAVELVLAKWACPPLENRGSTLVLRDLRAALHLDPSPQEPRL
jgi:hypothetical protein